MNWPCGKCESTEPGPRIGHECLCQLCDHEKELRLTERINREFEERALAKATHPSGKSPRYRTSLLWRTCTCNTPQPCWHGGVI